MNKPRSANRSERGQVLILIVLVVVGLFGMGALALDVGQVYYARRSAQAAADAAAMAAVYKAANMPRIENEDQYTVSELLQKPEVKARIAAGTEEAKRVARLNGIDNDENPGTITVLNPPATGPYCGTCNKPHAFDYWQVKVTVFTKPIFGHLIFSGFQQVTVETTARAESVDESTSGDAFVSLSKEAKSMLFNGNVKVNVSGGNIRSLGEMIRNGGGGGNNGDTDGPQIPPDVTVTNGNIFYGTTVSGKTSTMKPNPVKNTVTDYGSFEAPYCPAKAEAAVGNGWANKGTYFSKKLGSTDYFVHTSGLNIDALPAGIHCVYGDTKINGNTQLTGTGVLIVVMEGDFQVTGNGGLNLKASKNLKDNNGNKFGGMLMYVANTATIKLGGNTTDYFYGMIFAPKSACSIGGTSDTTAYHTAIICNTLKTHGNPAVTIVYKAEELFRLPPRVELIH